MDITLISDKIKRDILISYKEQYNLNIFIETGTFNGGTVESMMKYDFDKIYSIELDLNLFNKAKKKFESYDHIEIIHGDSGKELRNIMEKINKPSLFWLDAHYSGGITAKGEKDTPIYEELNCIFDYDDFGHVIIIDDARMFGTNPAYPTIEELEKFIYSKRKNVQIIIQNDSIRITNISKG